MGRVTSGILGVLTVLSLHTAAWAQQPPTPGPVDPGAAVAGPGFPQTGGPAPGSQAAQPGPYAYPQAPSSAAQPAYPPGDYAGQPAPSPYPPQGYAPPPPPPGYGAPSPYPPQGYAPPPPYSPYGYPYRRPAYGGYGDAAPRPYYGYPSAPSVPGRSVLDRPFELRLGVGISSLRYTNLFGERIDGQVGENLNLQLGFGLAPRLILLFGVDEVVSGGADYAYQQTALTVGLQVFLLQRLYLRGGLGVSMRIASNDVKVFADTQYGTAGLFGVGVELVQGYHWALHGEWDLIASHFSSDNATTSNESTWYSNSFGFGITFF